MQTSERSTRSRRFPPEQMPLSDPESQSSPSDTAQYMCIECSETFDTRLELNSHRQCHVTKKQFTCMHCGRGFHHQVFLQMHEQSHEDGVSKAPVKTTAARVISTRSSKTSAGVNVKPAYTKPQRPLNSAVEFKKDPKVCQAFTPKECITRRTHGASSPTFQTSDGPEKDHFELRISKFSDTTVELIDAFGNSIEIMTDVFNTYTISDPEPECSEEDNLKAAVDEALAETSVSSPSRNSQTDTVEDMQLSNEISSEPDSKNDVEEDPEECQIESSETSELKSNTDSSLPLCDVEMNENLTPETISPEDVVLPLPAPSILANASALEEEPTSQPSVEIPKPSIEETLQPAGVSQEDLPEDSRETVSPSPPSDICVTAEHQMDTSPENNEMLSASPASLPELQIEPADITEVDKNAENTTSVTLVANQSATDVNFQEISLQDNSSTSTVPAETSQDEDDQSTIDDAGLLKDSALNMTKSYVSEDKPSDEVVKEVVVDVERKEALTIQETDVQCEEQRVTPSPESLHKPDEHQKENICEPAAVSDSQLESNAEELSTKEDAKLDTCSKPEERTTTEGTEDENIEAKSTSPAENEPSESSNADMAVPSEYKIPPASNKDINLETEAAVCIAPQEVAEVSISEGDRDMQEGSKNSEKAASPLPVQDMLYNDLSEKRHVDLFERDIFQSETPMEVCEKGQSPHDSRGPHSTLMVQDKVDDICIDDDNNMTYISESEMIKLLEQDRDDLVDNNPPITTNLESTQPSQMEASETPPKPFTEPQIGNIAMETESFLTPAKQNVDEGTLTSHQPEASTSLQQNTMQGQNDLSKTPVLEDTQKEVAAANAWSPVSLPTNEEPGLADVEPEDPTNDLLPQDSITENASQEPVITEPSSSGDETVKNNLLPERSPLTENQHVEPHESISKALDVPSVGESIQSSAVHSNETYDVSVTVEDDGKEQTDTLELPEAGIEKQHASSPSHGLNPLILSDIGQKQNEIPESASDQLPAAPEEEMQKCISNQETDTPPQNARIEQEVTDKSSEVLDESARDVQNNHAIPSDNVEIKVGSADKQMEHASSIEMEISREKTTETDVLVDKQTTALSSDQDLLSCTIENSDVIKEIKEMGLEENVTLTELQNAELSEIPLVGFDPEDVANKSITDNVEEDLEEPSDTVAGVILDKDIAGSRKILDVITLSSGQPEGQDNPDVFLEDSELMEDEDEEDDAENIGTAKPLGSAAECSKCGRRLRRSRKEMTLLTMCFKCRKAERKRHVVNQDVNEHSKLGQELQPSRKERLSGEFSNSKIKLEQDSLQTAISKDPTTYADSSVSVGVKKEGPGPASKKMYKCPKCDKSFKIPALLAGHIRTHTLPQCLTCGCHMQLKYKTKRIPRRCKKCTKQLKEQRKERLNAEQSEDDDSETTDIDELSRGKNPEVDMSDDEDSSVIVQKSKRTDPDHPANLVGKSLDDTDSFKNEVENSEGHESSDELEISDQSVVLPDGDSPRLCHQCGKSFKCNRSLHLHLLSHSAIQCESCGCRLHKKRRVGRWSKKCRACRLQSKSRLFDDSGEQLLLPSDRALKQKHLAALRLKAKQLHIMKNRKIRSMIKQKKELKLMNMMLAVKGLMNKARKKKEIASKSVELIKDVENSEAGISDTSSVNESIGIAEDHPKTNLSFLSKEEPGSSGLQNFPKKALSSTPKRGRKCLYTEKNIIKVEENDNVPCGQGEVSSFAAAFIKQEETWECLECTISMPNLETLLSHQQGHIGGQSFTCTQCPQVFSSEQYLNIHIHAHDEDRPFRCPDCDKTFTKRNHLGVHMRVHSGVRPFACLECPCRFRQKASLIAHRYSHRNYQLLFAKPYQCSMCTKSFKQRERLVVHERLHTGECPFSCKDCDKVFPSKARLNVHRKMHRMSDPSSTNEQKLTGKEVLEGSPFRCQDCGKVCSTKASFVLHRKIHRLSEKIHHPNLEEHPFNCRECNKVFSSKATLKMHLKNHSAHKPAASPGVVPDFQQCFLCKDCGKVCSTKASFVLHRKVHKSLSSAEQQVLDIKVEPESQVYVCKDCGKVCSTKASFVLHYKVHKSTAGTEPNINIKTEPETQVFVCKDCDKVCLTKASLALHCKVHKSPFDEQNLKVKTEPGTQTFICKDCGKVCSTKASLVLHSRVHKSPFSNEQNLSIKSEPGSLAFICKYCDKVCSTKASLVLHCKVHKTPGAEAAFKTDTEKKSFVCKFCKAVFYSKTSFFLHRKMHRLPAGQPSPKGNAEERQFNCKHCDMVCSTKASFVLHSKIHKLSSVDEQTSKDAEPQSYSCKDCDMVCSTKASFALHSKVHKSPLDSEDNVKTDVQSISFTCKECGKVCSTKASFVLHCKMHKSPSSDAQCKICGKVCSNTGRLSIHSKVHEPPLTSNQNSGSEMDTEQPKKTSEEKTFACATCGLKFPKLKLLLRHKVVHGERTVMPCVHCGKRFLYKKSLFNHVNICQGQNKGKLLLLKKAAAKRKLVTEEGADGTEEDNAQKKKKTDENKATKLKNKNLIKAKKVALKKEGSKVKGVSDAKTKTPKVKRPKCDGETIAEGEDKKTVTEKQGDVKQEKPAETTSKQQIGKEKKTTMKVKKPKKDLTKQKQEKVGSGGSKKWRVLATTVKKKKLQAVIIGGKKKLLLKKKGVQVKPKAGGKGSKD